MLGRWGQRGPGKRALFQPEVCLPPSNLLNTSANPVSDDSEDDCFLPSQQPKGSSGDEEGEEEGSASDGVTVKKRRQTSHTPRSTRKGSASGRTPSKKVGRLLKIHRLEKCTDTWVDDFLLLPAGSAHYSPHPPACHSQHPCQVPPSSETQERAGGSQREVIQCTTFHGSPKPSWGFTVLSVPQGSSLFRNLRMADLRLA